MSNSKIVTDNLIKWDDSSVNALAPLTINQKEWLENLEEEILLSDSVNFNETPDKRNLGENNHFSGTVERIETCQELLQCYTELEKK